MVDPWVGWGYTVHTEAIGAARGSTQRTGGHHGTRALCGCVVRPVAKQNARIS